MYCFIYYTVVYVSSFVVNSDTTMLDTLQDLKEEYFEQFEQQGK
jgi:hypothetical protein